MLRLLHMPMVSTAWCRVAALAAVERRSASAQIAVLLDEALQARREKC